MEQILLNRQDETYVESCLPFTLKLAESYKGFLLSKFEENDLPKEWTWGDKLLVFLLPSFMTDVQNYFNGNGPTMTDMFEDFQLQKFDQMLCEILQKKYPEDLDNESPTSYSTENKLFLLHQDQEKEIVLLAQRREGKLTMTEILQGTSLSIVEATERIKDIVSRGYAQEILTKAGVITYEFSWEIMFVQKQISPQQSSISSSSSSSSKAPQYGKIRCIITEKLLFKTPEERVRQEIAKRLITDYWYQRKDIEIEYTIDMAIVKKRADIVIFLTDKPHTQENIFAIIETKAQTVSNKEVKEAFGQLKSCVAASMNCQYASLAWSKWRTFQVKNVDGHRKLQAIKSFPRSAI